MGLHILLYDDHKLIMALYYKECHYCTGISFNIVIYS